RLKAEAASAQAKSENEGTPGTAVCSAGVQRFAPTTLNGSLIMKILLKTSVGVLALMFGAGMAVAQDSSAPSSGMGAMPSDFTCDQLASLDDQQAEQRIYFIAGYQAAQSAGVGMDSTASTTPGADAGMDTTAGAVPSADAETSTTAEAPAT